MSANNNERRELTAAELDLVVGAAIFMKIDGVKATSVVRLDRGVVRTLRMRMTGHDDSDAMAIAKANARIIRSYDSVGIGRSVQGNPDHLVQFRNLCFMVNNSFMAGIGRFWGSVHGLRPSARGCRAR